jgi:hypothetical protein
MEIPRRGRDRLGEGERDRIPFVGAGLQVTVRFVINVPERRAYP